jgi:hypothetical protein
MENLTWDVLEFCKAARELGVRKSMHDNIFQQDLRSHGPPDYSRSQLHQAPQQLR